MSEEFVEIIIDKNGKMKIETHGIESDCLETIEKILKNIVPSVKDIEHTKKAREEPNYSNQDTKSEIDLDGGN